MVDGAHNEYVNFHFSFVTRMLLEPQVGRDVKSIMLSKALTAVEQQ